jgi:TM2 domain-containing membrane protein YozV
VDERDSDEWDSEDELEPRQLAFVEAQVEAESKSVRVAYVLWWFLGFIFAHRFYLNRNGPRYAAAAITAEVLGYMASRVLAGVGLVALVLLGIVWIADAIRMPRWIDEDDQAHRVRLIEGILANTADSPARTARRLARAEARQRLESVPVEEGAAQSSGPIFNDGEAARAAGGESR